MGGNLKRDLFKIANKIFRSRLIVGTGKYKNFLETAKAIDTSGGRFSDSCSKKSEYNQ